MQGLLKQCAVHLVVVSGVVAANLVLFLLIPSLHQAVVKRGVESGLAQKVRVVADLQPPKEQKKQLETKRLRPMALPSAQAQADRTQLKFTPDLGVAAGGGVALDNADFGAMVFEEGQTEENAIPTHQSPPQYPDRARKDGVEGDVSLLFVVNESGSVESVEILSSPHPLLSESCRRAIQSWRFKPARNKGVPVKMRFRIRFPFVLES